MSEERAPQDLDLGVYREGESMEEAGRITYPIFDSTQDPNELVDNPEHGKLRNIIDTIHGAGQEAFGQIDAHKGLAITILGSAAVAAGAVGIGILIKRRENKNAETQTK